MREMRGDRERRGEERRRSREGRPEAIAAEGVRETNRTTSAAASVEREGGNELGLGFLYRPGGGGLYSPGAEELQRSDGNGHGGWTAVVPRARPAHRAANGPAH
jgi:hypothetical protein